MPDAPSAVTYPLTGGSTDSTLSIWLFKDVKNSKCVVGRSLIAFLTPPPAVLPNVHIVGLALYYCRSIKEQIVAGSILPELAFINAILVTGQSLPVLPLLLLWM